MRNHGQRTILLPKRDKNIHPGSDIMKKIYVAIIIAITLPVLWSSLALYYGFEHNAQGEYCEYVQIGEPYHLIFNGSPCRLTTEPLLDFGIGMLVFGIPPQFLVLLWWIVNARKERKKLKNLKTEKDYVKKPFSLNVIQKALVFSIVVPLFIVLMNIGSSIFAEPFQDYCNADGGCKMLDYIFIRIGHNIHLLGYCLLFQSVVLIGWGMVSVYDRLRKWKNK